ncbi:hypothetical protein CY34DRAFT_91600 [Suillus luteus UH-Slu-Lm8-n1]|uniref:Retrotransposon gag domain-containing protein n=1 Tax=Suillus luteus UH-Slu-Lm8-n1 TaxID=930992 RepID=A0A0C9ZKS3_9AGAM|nr:hypothetical protein CY34DRAFT_91600 [Suillus luteus UH-Slu-Lm8-n1]
MPSPFNGDTRTAQGWALQLEAYLHLNTAVYDTDEKKVIFLLSRMMKGEAAKWAEGHLKTAIAAGTYGTFATLTTNFKAMFFPKNVAQTAICRISSLRQTGSVAAYASLFRTILADTGITEEVTRIMFFRNGLKREITHTILTFENIPNTLDNWLDKALDVEVRRMLINPPTYSKAKDPYAMDIDRMEMEEDSEGEKRTRKTYLTPQERERRRKNGLCFKCGKKGLAKDCPNHPTMTAAKKVVKEDDDYAEFLEWKAFKTRQARKGKAKKEESEEEEDF